MKSVFTLLIGVILYSLNALAAPTTPTSPTSTKTEYFVCKFNQTVTKCEINQLEQLGFQVFETNNDKRVIYVKSNSSAIFTSVLKSKMDELIQIDEYGNRIHLLEAEPEDSPDFLKLFFNFI